MIAKGAFGLLLSAALLLGCSDEEINPLSAREEQLVGLWRLDLAAVDDEDFEFTYEFERDKGVTNRVGGEFLKTLRERPELAEVDFKELENVDGGTVQLRGRWNLVGDTLDVVFESLDVTVFGSVPVLGRLSVPVYFANLPEDRDYEITYTCEITDDELTLEGQALTVGVPLDQAAESQLPAEGPGVVGMEAIRMMADFLLQVVRQENLNQATFSKVK